MKIAILAASLWAFASMLTLMFTRYDAQPRLVRALMNWVERQDGRTLGRQQFGRAPNYPDSAIRSYPPYEKSLAQAFADGYAAEYGWGTVIEYCKWMGTWDVKIKDPPRDIGVLTV